MKIRDKIRAKAATKIQSWFRCRRQRKKFKKELALSKIEKLERNEMAIALQALEQAKIIRKEAENEKAKALEVLNIAKGRTKELQAVNVSNYTADSKKFITKPMSLRNMAALLIQRNWRKHLNKKKQKLESSAKKNITPKIYKTQSFWSNSTKSTTDEHNDVSSSIDKSKFLHRQNTGSKLNTLPKSSATSSPQNGTIQFETGNFNKVFKSTVALGGRDTNIKQETPKRSETPALQIPNTWNVGKSMDIGAKLIANQGKRLRYFFLKSN